MTTVFNTKFLEFRPFTAADLEPLAQICADRLTSTFVGDGEPLSRIQTAEWIENSRRNVSTHGYGTGAVVLRSTGTLIGWGGIARPPDEPEELIYGLYRSYWGRGLGTELLSGLCKWGFDQLGLAQIRATVHERNTASVRMLTRAGFEFRDSDDQSEPEWQLFVANRHVAS